MQETRLALIRTVAENLAKYVEASHDASYFGRLFRCRRFRDLMLLLLRADERCKTQGWDFVIGFEEAVAVFGIAEDLAYPDWGLARDLLLLRTLEVLQERQVMAEELGHELGEDLEQAEEAETALAG